MAKLEIPVRIYVDELEEFIKELKKLQTYVLSEDDKDIYINRDDVVELLINHLAYRNENVINRQTAINAIEHIGPVATLYDDNDKLIRLSAVKYVLSNL